MTTTIKEKFTGRRVDIEGDIVQAMKACIWRNKNFEIAGIPGEYSVSIGVPFHLEPHEYEGALLKWGESLTFHE